GRLGLSLDADRPPHRAGEGEGEGRAGSAASEAGCKLRGGRQAAERRARHGEDLYRNLVPNLQYQLRWLGGAGATLGRLPEREGRVAPPSCSRAGPAFRAFPEQLECALRAERTSLSPSS